MSGSQFLPERGHKLNPPPVCFNCGVTGHFVVACPLESRESSENFGTTSIIHSQYLNPSAPNIQSYQHQIRPHHQQRYSPRETVCHGSAFACDQPLCEASSQTSSPYFCPIYQYNGPYQYPSSGFTSPGYQYVYPACSAHQIPICYIHSQNFSSGPHIPMTHYSVTPNSWSDQTPNPDYHTPSSESISGPSFNQTSRVGQNLKDPVDNDFQSKINQDITPSQGSQLLRSNFGSSPCDYISDCLVEPSLSQNRKHQIQPTAEVAANSFGASTNPRILSEETRLKFKSNNLLDVERQEDSWNWEYEKIFKDPPIAETVALAQPLAVAFKSTPVPLMQPCSKLDASISRYARKENLKEFIRSIRSTPQWSYMQEDPAFSEACLDGQLIPLDQIHTWTASRHGKNQSLETLSERYANKPHLKRAKSNEMNDLDAHNKKIKNSELDNFSTKRHKIDNTDDEPKDVFTSTDILSSISSRKSAIYNDTVNCQNKDTAVSVSACSPKSPPTALSHLGSTQKTGILSKRKFHFSDLSRPRYKKTQTLVSALNGRKDLSINALPDPYLSIDQQPEILNKHASDISLNECDKSDYRTPDRKTLHQQKIQQLNKSYSSPQESERRSSQFGRADTLSLTSSITSSCNKLLENARNKSCKKGLAVNPHFSLNTLFSSRNSTNNERLDSAIHQFRHSTNFHDAPSLKQFAIPNKFEEKKKSFPRQPPRNNATEDRHNFARQHGSPMKDIMPHNLDEQVIHRPDLENVESFIKKQTLLIKGTTVRNLESRKTGFLEKSSFPNDRNSLELNFGQRQEPEELDSSCNKQSQSDLQYESIGEKNIVMESYLLKVSEGQVNGPSTISSLEISDKITTKPLGFKQSNSRRNESVKKLKRQQPKVEEAYSRRW